MSVKDPGSRLLRWRIQLEEYDYEYEIVYKPGTQNSNADALSRIGTLSKEGSDEEETNQDTKERGEIDEAIKKNCRKTTIRSSAVIAV
jgi:hypothetical protein